jgi:hypothetical protein
MGSLGELAAARAVETGQGGEGSPELETVGGEEEDGRLGR